MEMVRLWVLKLQLLLITIKRKIDRWDRRQAKTKMFRRTSTEAEQLLSMPTTGSARVPKEGRQEGIRRPVQRQTPRACESKGNHWSIFRRNKSRRRATHLNASRLELSRGERMSATSVTRGDDGKGGELHGLKIFSPWIL